VARFLPFEVWYLEFVWDLGFGTWDFQRRWLGIA
jgi:hypothetical protein